MEHSERIDSARDPAIRGGACNTARRARWEVDRATRNRIEASAAFLASADNNM